MVQHPGAGAAEAVDTKGSRVRVRLEESTVVAEDTTLAGKQWAL